MSRPAPVKPWMRKTGAQQTPSGDVVKPQGLMGDSVASVTEDGLVDDGGARADFTSTKGAGTVPGTIRGTVGTVGVGTTEALATAGGLATSGTLGASGALEAPGTIANNIAGGATAAGLEDNDLSVVSTNGAITNGDTVSNTMMNSGFMYGGGGLYGGTGNQRGNDFFGNHADSLFQFNEFLSFNGRILDKMANLVEIGYEQVKATLGRLIQLLKYIRRLAIPFKSDPDWRFNVKDGRWYIKNTVEILEYERQEENARKKKRRSLLSKIFDEIPALHYRRSIRNLMVFFMVFRFYRWYKQRRSNVQNEAILSLSKLLYQRRT